jgi:hypothetical protein
VKFNLSISAIGGIIFFLSADIATRLESHSIWRNRQRGRHVKSSNCQHNTGGRCRSISLTHRTAAVVD